MFATHVDVAGARVNLIAYIAFGILNGVQKARYNLRIAEGDGGGVKITENVNLNANVNKILFENEK